MPIRGRRTHTDRSLIATAPTPRKFRQRSGATASADRAIAIYAIIAPAPVNTA
jgi:hypothetical protein